MPQPATQTLSLTLSATPRSAAAARSALHRLELDPDTHADAALLISELVSAAILDCVENGDGVDLTLTCSPERVRAEVTANAPGLAGLGSRDPETHGFTIRLLDDLATAWGEAPATRGTTVYFEVRRGA